MTPLEPYVEVVVMKGEGMNWNTPTVTNLVD